MQRKAVYLLLCKFTLHVSGVNHTHHQEYTKLKLQPSVLVIFFCAATSLQRGGSCTKKYDQYRRLYLQFCVLLMMGVVDTRNM